MLITGIIGQTDKEKTANIINSILSFSKKRVSIIDSKALINLDEKRIRLYFDELKKGNVEILVLKVNLDELKREIFSNISFDIIIFADKADDISRENDSIYKELMRKGFSLLNEKGIAIINADDSDINQFMEGIKHYIVTYGFNPKASVTTSSIGDLMEEEDIMFCLQRSIYTKKGALIEPQEFKMRADVNGANPYNVLAAATFAIINDVDLNSIR